MVRALVPLTLAAALALQRAADDDLREVMIRELFEGRKER